MGSKKKKFTHKGRSGEEDTTRPPRILAKGVTQEIKGKKKKGKVGQSKNRYLLKKKEKYQYGEDKRGESSGWNCPFPAKGGEKKKMK